MQPENNKQQKIAIIILIVMVVAGFFFMLITGGFKGNNSIYKDPNNGEQVVENPTTTPETVGERTITITGRKELLAQGVTSEAVRSLDQLFLTYKPAIKLASIVSDSVSQERKDSSSNFNYYFDVQIDKGDYFTVEITFTDSVTGKSTLYTKDMKQQLGSQIFGPEDASEAPPEESTQ